MKIENTVVYGFQPAIRGMRNPKESWGRSDSVFFGYPSYNDLFKWPNITVAEYPEIGPYDLKLMKSLAKAGGEHRKYLRMINVWADLTLTRSVLTELDTYKVSTTRNSCSTMHKLGHYDLMEKDFDFVRPDDKYSELQKEFDNLTKSMLQFINNAGAEYRKNKDFGIVRSMKSIISEGLLQKITYHMNYEVAHNILHQRRNHRLPDWHIICDWIESLPYFKEIFENEKAEIL